MNKEKCSDYRCFHKEGHIGPVHEWKLVEKKIKPKLGLFGRHRTYWFQIDDFYCCGKPLWKAQEVNILQCGCGEKKEQVEDDSIAYCRYCGYTATVCDGYPGY